MTGRMIVYALIAIADSAIAYLMFAKLFEFRKELIVPIALFAMLVVAVNVFVPIYIDTKYNAVMNLILSGCLLQISFRGKTGNKLVYYMLFYIIAVVSETLVAGVYIFTTGKEWSTNDIDSFIIMGFVAAIAKVLFVKLWEFFWNRRNHRIEGKFFYMLMLLPIVTIVASLMLFDLLTEPFMTVVHRRLLSVMTIAFFLVNIIVFYLTEKMSSLIEEQKNNELFRQKINMEEHHYSKVVEMSRQQMIYRHDMKHYLSALYGLVSQNEDAAKMITQMQEQISSTTAKMYTQCGILNALLSEKEEMSAASKVKLVIDMEPDVDISFIKEIDIIAMFGNLINNAVRAASECTIIAKREVVVRLFETEGNFIIFSVENFFEGEIEKQGEHFITTKKEKCGHGIGIESVKNLATKYGGILDIEIKEHWFMATLSISKGIKQEEDNENNPLCRYTS